MTIPCFTSIEVKKPGRSHTSKEQKQWRDNVLAAGGLAGIAKSEDEAIAIVQAAHP